MAYCVLADVQNLIPTLTLSGSSKPTTTQASAIIDIITADINMALQSRSFTLPVTDLTAVASLKTVCVYGSAAAILRAMFPADAGIGSGEGSAAFWETKYQASLKAFIDGSLGIEAPADENNVGSGFGEGDPYDPATAPYAWRDMEW